VAVHGVQVPSSQFARLHVEVVLKAVVHDILPVNMPAWGGARCSGFQFRLRILAWVLLARATLRLGARVRLPGFDVVVLGPATSSASDLAACLLVLRPVVVLACLVAVAYGVASAALEQLVRVVPAARVAREGHLGDLFFLGGTSSHFWPSSQGGDGLFPKSRVRSR